MFHNAAIRHDMKQSPHQMFTGEQPPWKMSDFRVFGCPIFVLDKRLHDRDSIPKWKALSWTGVYVGHTLQHAGNVPLIYNPSTMYISPQYHVAFDNPFTTVCGSTEPLSDAFYKKLYTDSSWLYKDTYGDPSDLHLFESFWADPPSLNKSYHMPLKRPHKSNCRTRTTISNAQHSETFKPQPTQKHSDHAGNHNCNHAEHISGDHARYPVCDHAEHLKRDHAEHPTRDQAGHPTCDHTGHLTRDHAGHPTCDHARHLTGDQAEHPTHDHATYPTGDHAGHPKGNHAMHPASNHAGHHPCDHVVHAAGEQTVLILRPIQNPNPDTTSSAPTAYINLQHVACSAVFLVQQQSRGEHANVYTAHSSLPSVLIPTAPS